jgi:hypothetical protein
MNLCVLRRGGDASIAAHFYRGAVAQRQEESAHPSKSEHQTNDQTQWHDPVIRREQDGDDKG